VNDGGEKKLIPASQQCRILLGDVTTAGLSTLTDGTVVIRGVDRTIFGPRDRRMLRASLSSALKMRQRNAAFAETPQAARRRQARLAIDLAISNVFGIEGKALWRGTRGVRDIAEARQVAMYLAHVCCRMSLTEVGAMFGRDRTTVAHACLKVEYRRDDPNFDRALDVLGWALPTLVMREASPYAPKPQAGIEDQEWM
jgi:hypothetical protein